MKKAKNHEAKLAVAQVYWNADQAYRAAEYKRGRARDLALVAIAKGETIGPVYARRECDEYADTCGHWLTHGEKEHVEMRAFTLYQIAKDRMHISDLFKLCSVNMADLKEHCPDIYAQMLKHPTSKRTAHSCLTWSEKAPAAKRRAKR